jgi:hypothetical protein
MDTNNKFDMKSTTRYTSDNNDVSAMINVFVVDPHDQEKLELFQKIEPYLTYLDYSELEARGADVETKLQEKDSRIQGLEEKLTELSRKLYQAGILKKD